MHKRGLLAIVILSAFLSSAGPSFADNQPFTRVPHDELSYWLETRFSQLMGVCLPGTGGTVKVDPGWSSRDETISAVPGDLITSFNLSTSQKVSLFSSATVRRIFGYIYAPSEITDPKHPVYSGLGNYLPLDYTLDHDQLPEEGLNHQTYNRTCQMTLDVKASASSTFPLTVASLSAAANAALSRKFNSEIRLATGTFSSPLWAMWQQDLLPVTVPNTRYKPFKAFAGIVMFKYLNSHPADKDHKLLASIKGHSAYLLTENSATTSAGASFQGSLKIPFLTVDAQTSGSYSNNSSLDASNFEFMLDATTTPNFQPFPDIDALLRGIALAPSTLVYSDDGGVLRSNSKTIFYEDVDGIPAGYCDDDEFALKSDNNNLKLTHVHLQEGSPALCRFTFTFDPGEVVSTNELDLSFAIVSVDQVEGKQFSIPIKAAFTQSNLPLVTLVSLMPAKPQAGTPGNETQLTWTIPLRLTDQNSVDGAYDGGYLELDCGDGIPIVTAAALLTPGLPAKSGSPSRPLSLVISAPYEDSVTAAQAAASNRECHVNGSIYFVIGSKIIPRHLKTDAVVVLAPPAPM